MCGIAGLWSFRPSSHKPLALVERMSTCLGHRGPDKQGTWASDDGQLALGHRRLAIIDLSEDGTQPMHSASGRYALVYNGEIYNYKDLRDRLETAGAAFKGHSDTEVFLMGVEMWGLERTLQDMRGMFAVALWDRRERQLHLVRDRLGKKPLYVGWCGGDLVFASELKAFHQHPEFKKQVNPQGQSAFTQYGYIPAPLTIFKDVWTLLPGHVLTLKQDRVAPGMELAARFQPYWDIAQVCRQSRNAPVTSEPQEMVREFDSLLRDCVAERMMASDVPIGAFLSGGLDSSAIVALMQTQADKPVKTYTIGFHETGFNEAEHAKDIAQHLGTDHHELYVTGADALAVVDKLPQMYDEPFADISAIPTYLVSKFAREGVTVALSGDGGDEMLGGYNRHSAAPRIWRKIKNLPLPLRKIAAQIILSQSPARLGKLKPNHPQFGESLHKVAGLLQQAGTEEIYQRLLSQIDQPETYLQAPVSQQIPLTDPANRIEGASFAEQMMFSDALHYLPNDILVKVDRASMAVALEARAPLLDSRVFEYVWRLPEEVKIRNGQGKWLLRQVLKQYVPEELFERPKQGFNIPVAAWLGGELRAWTEELLQVKALEEQGFKSAQIRSLWQAHKAGQVQHAGFLWAICQYQAWAKQWV